MACFQLYLRRPVEEFEVEIIQETLIYNNTKLAMFIISSLTVIHSSVIDAHLLVTRFGSSGARMSEPQCPGLHSEVNKTQLTLQSFFFLTEQLLLLNKNSPKDHNLRRQLYIFVWC